MPELPEVETVCRGLEAALSGRKILRLTQRRADLRFPLPERFAEQVEGRRLLSVSRRAKYLVFTLAGGLSMLAHLGMSGQMLVSEKPPAKPQKHDHLLFAFDGGMHLTYRDPRRFGLFDLVETAHIASHHLLAHLGPEPLEKSFNIKYLSDMLQRRTGAIKPVLMDQKLVVGVGNIYASEALFLAGIHPETPAHDAVPHAAALVKAIRQVLKAAIASGGSTLRDYVRSSGDAGYFQHDFSVYDRAEKPCKRCQEPIQHMVQAGRSTYCCPRCQPSRAAPMTKYKKAETKRKKPQVNRKK